MAVMINIHHFNELDKDPAQATDEFSPSGARSRSTIKIFQHNSCLNWIMNRTTGDDGADESDLMPGAIVEIVGAIRNEHWS